MVGNKNVIIPSPIQPGDLVAVVAPSGPPSEELVRLGLHFMKRKGFNIVTGRHLSKRYGYLAGTDDERIEDLNDALRNPLVKAVVFARGGYGAMRILNSIDCDAFCGHPKILLGMSDITVLHMSLYGRCGLVTFAGPMLADQIADGLDPISETSLLKALTEPLQGRELFDGVEGHLRILRPGRATGALLGGCLSLITALMGTPHLPDLTGSILFVEDVHEPPYRIDRMFTQLMLAGVLDRLGALILGHFVGPDDSDVLSECERIVMELTSSSQIPIVSGFQHGHKLPNITIPNGIRVELDTSCPRLTTLID